MPLLISVALSTKKAEIIAVETTDVDVVIEILSISILLTSNVLFWSGSILVSDEEILMLEK